MLGLPTVLLGPGGGCLVPPVSSTLHAAALYLAAGALAASVQAR